MILIENAAFSRFYRNLNDNNNNRRPDLNVKALSSFANIRALPKLLLLPA